MGAAFARYQTAMRPYVDKCQDLPNTVDRFTPKSQSDVTVNGLVWKWMQRWPFRPAWPKGCGSPPRTPSTYRITRAVRRTDAQETRASASSCRERISSLLYVFERCISTVRSVTNSDCAISLLLTPPAAS